VLFYVLAQSSDRTFFFANGELKFLVEAMDARQILGTEQLKQERGHLREITEHAFDFGMKAVIFRAVGHLQFRC